MKFVSSVVILALVIFSSACNKGGGDSNNSNNTAATPQTACGNGIPNQYCTPYNPSTYPNSPYAPYSPYGNGNPYTYGPGQPNYPGAYGCPYGFQPVYTGGAWPGTQMSCVSVNYFQNYGTPYYNPYYRWSVGGIGYGPIMACALNPDNSDNCPAGSFCQLSFGSRFGHCVVQ